MGKKDDKQKSLADRARPYLDQRWSRITKLGDAGKLHDFVDDENLREAIRAVINSKTKSYRYVLPTQLVAKLADPSLDCRCLQASRGGRGAFDARTVAHGVVVPFDQANESVLGGSPEPYVNNPLRVPEVSSAHRGAQKNKEDWDVLCRVLQAVEQATAPAFANKVLLQALAEVYRRLAQIRVVYPAPKRISLEDTLRIISAFLKARSGGERLLAVTSALFVVIGRRFRLYDKVRRNKITAADKSTGMLADLECLAEGGRIVLVVEVKDRGITITEIGGKLKEIRERKVSEIFFVAEQGVRKSDQGRVPDLIRKEFAAGQNIYITDLESLGRASLALLGEQGRREFISEVGPQLEDYGSGIAHRRAWAGLLGSV